MDEGGVKGRGLRLWDESVVGWDHTLKLKPATPAQIANQRWVQEAEGPDMVEDIGGTWGLQQLIEAYEAWAASGGAERDEDDYSGMFEAGWRPDRNKWMG